MTYPSAAWAANCAGLSVGAAVVVGAGAVVVGAATVVVGAGAVVVGAGAVVVVEEFGTAEAGTEATFGVAGTEADARFPKPPPVPQIPSAAPPAVIAAEAVNTAIAFQLGMFGCLTTVPPCGELPLSPLHQSATSG